MQFDVFGVDRFVVYMEWRVSDENLICGNLLHVEDCFDILLGQAGSLSLSRKSH